MGPWAGEPAMSLQALDMVRDNMGQRLGDLICGWSGSSWGLSVMGVDRMNNR